jgi:hypothetical protein
MQYQVPQFDDVEDKIAGPFTLRQFIYICTSIGASFFLYFTVHTLPWLIMSVFVVGGGFALAFIKINGQYLPKVLWSALRFYWRPQIYVWQPDRPDFNKNQASVGSDYLQQIISGVALRSAWQSVSLGQGIEERLKRPNSGPTPEKYQIYQKITGERIAARRVDYR